ncbi:MAG: branched-chain amino acid ABC transporter permease, partial [Deltaproteobacteria bacterium]|nr:branched-chain amino acid ABC transporter permease [Deltaproteobacteria bacterium]
MEFFLQSLINGILLGGIYALCSAGFSLAFGVMGVVNLSHGDFLMVGAFITYWLFILTGMDPFLTLPFCIVGLFGLGFLLQRLALNRLVGAPPIMTYLLTFGFHLILANAALRAWTADYRNVNVSYAGATFALGGLVLPYARVITFALAMAINGGLYILLYRTEVGRAIRATSQDREMARLMGVRIFRIYTF